MTRVEEARAEKHRQENSVDQYIMGLPIPASFFETDLFENEESKEAVKKEVKEEVKTEVMQAVEQKLSEALSKLEEQKQANSTESQGSLDIVDSDDLDILGNFVDIEIDYENIRIKEAIKDVIGNVQPQLGYIAAEEIRRREEELLKKEEELQKQRAEEIRRKEEEIKKKEEELKIKETVEEKKKKNKLLRFFLWLRIRIKNNLVFKFVFEVVISAIVLFGVYEFFYLWNAADAAKTANDEFDLVKSLLASLDYLKDYLHLFFEQIPKPKQ